MKQEQFSIFDGVAIIQSETLMREDLRSPKDANKAKLWAHLKIKYRDGDEMVDEEGIIWDVWRKEDGFVLYAVETKETIEVPRPKSMGG